MADEEPLVFPFRSRVKINIRTLYGAARVYIPGIYEYISILVCIFLCSVCITTRDTYAPVIIMNRLSQHVAISQRVVTFRKASFTTLIARRKNHVKMYELIYNRCVPSKREVWKLYKSVIWRESFSIKKQNNGLLVTKIKYTNIT